MHFASSIGDIYVHTAMAIPDMPDDHQQMQCKCEQHTPYAVRQPFGQNVLDIARRCTPFYPSGSVTKGFLPILWSAQSYKLYVQRGGTMCLTPLKPLTKKFWKTVHLTAHSLNKMFGELRISPLNKMLGELRISPFLKTRCLENDTVEGLPLERAVGRATAHIRKDRCGKAILDQSWRPIRPKSRSPHSQRQGQQHEERSKQKKETRQKRDKRREREHRTKRKIERSKNRLVTDLEG